MNDKAKIDGVCEECGRQLAINFDWPAKDILSYYGSKIGLTWGEMHALMGSRVAKS